MQVHRDHVIAARGLQHVGHEARRDRGTRAVLLVLPRVGEVGYHRRDAPGRGGLAGGNYYQQLHYVIIYVAWCGGLEDED